MPVDAHDFGVSPEREDNSLQLNNAITYASENRLGKVMLRAGSYGASHIVKKEHVRIQGVSEAATELRSIGGNDDFIVSDRFYELTGQNKCLARDGVPNNVGLEDLRVNAKAAKRAVVLYAKNIRLENVEIFGAKGTGLYTELGSQCPLNRWDIRVEGKISNLVVYNCDGWAWECMGPHDQSVPLFKAYECGKGVLVRGHPQDTFVAVPDFGDVQVYSVEGPAMHVIDTYIKAMRLRLENSDAEGLILENSDGSIITHLDMIDNCRRRGAYAIEIDAKSTRNQIGQLDLNRVGRETVGGYRDRGSNNAMTGSIYGTVNRNNSTFSNGVAVDLDGATYPVVNFTAADFRGPGGTGLRLSKNNTVYWPRVDATLFNCDRLFENTRKSVGALLRIVGNNPYDKPFVGVGPNTHPAFADNWSGSLRDGNNTLYLDKME